MLKKENRLSNLKAKVKSQNFETSLFKIKVFSKGNGITRFAFVVSKKVDNRAVVRNKTKRVLRKALKNILENIKNGQSVIIVAKNKIEFSQEQAAQQLLEQAFKKAGLLK